MAVEVAKKFPLSPKSLIEYLGEPLPNPLFLSSTTPTEGSASSSSLKDNRASGSNSIPIKLLKMLNLISQFHYLFLSFESRIFPDKLKIAQIIVI